MTLTIDLPEEQTLALNARAAREGVSSEQYVRRMLEHDLAPAWLRESWTRAADNGTDRLSLEKIDAEIQEVRKSRRAADS